MYDFVLKKFQVNLFRQFRAHLRRYSGLRHATLLKKRPWHRCFLVNFGKFFRISFLQNTSRWLFLFKPLLFLFMRMTYTLHPKWKMQCLLITEKLFISYGNIGELFGHMNKEIESVYTWFKAKKLSLYW